MNKFKMASQYLNSATNYILVGKFFGISQLSLSTPNSDGRDPDDYVDVLYSLPFIGVYIYISYLSVADLQYYATIQEHDIPLSAIAILLTQNILTVFLNTIYFFIKRMTFKRAMHRIDALNGALKLPERSYMADDIRVLAMLLLAVMFNFYVEMHSAMTLPIILVHQLIYFMNYVEIALIKKMLDEMAHQCAAINDRLQKRIAFLDRSGGGEDIWDELLDVKKLRESEKDAFFENAAEMAEAHLEMGKIAREINDVFGVSVLLGVLSDFTMLTLTTVQFCQDIRALLILGYVDLGIMSKAFRNAFHDALILTKECFNIYYWTKLKKTLKTTITCLHKMWNTLAKHNEIDEKSNYLQLLIVQLYNGMPNFSAYGIITMDWPLIIMVISSAATYVVIIMQFQLATNTTTNANSTNVSLVTTTAMTTIAL